VINGEVGGPRLRRTARPRALARFADALTSLGASARCFERCLRVARTVADLAAEEVVDSDHLDEAMAYRLSPVTVSEAGS
jgi:magnesium chelatase family protein